MVVHIDTGGRKDLGHNRVAVEVQDMAVGMAVVHNMRPVGVHGAESVVDLVPLLLSLSILRPRLC